MPVNENDDQENITLLEKANEYDKEFDYPVKDSINRKNDPINSDNNDTSTVNNSQDVFVSN